MRAAAALAFVGLVTFAAAPVHAGPALSEATKAELGNATLQLVTLGCGWGWHRRHWRTAGAIGTGGAVFRTAGDLGADANPAPSAVNIPSHQRRGSPRADVRRGPHSFRQACGAAGLGEGRRQGGRKGEAGAGLTRRKGRLQLQHTRCGGPCLGDPAETAK